MKPKFSVIIPVYNEEKILKRNVIRLIKFLNKHEKNYEIILGNNGSTDKTKEIVKKLEKKFGKVRLASTAEKGVGNGIKIAIMASRSDNIIEMPMDLSIDPDFIPKSAGLLKKYSMVIGSKKAGEQDRAWWQELLSSGYIFLTNIFFGLSFTDYSVGGKAYRKSVILSRLDKIDKGSFYVTDFIYHTKKRKLNIIEIPIFCRDKRKSKFNMSKEVLYRLKKLFSLRFSEW